MNYIKILVIMAYVFLQSPLETKSNNKTIEELQTDLTEFRLKLEADLEKDDLIKSLKESITIQQTTMQSSEKSVVDMTNNIRIVHLLLKACRKGINKNDKSKTIQVIDCLSQYTDNISKPATSCEPFGYDTAIHELHYPGIKPFSVHCDGDTAGPGWTLIQHRYDGSVDFYKSWNEYRKGFGSLSGEYFIGLDMLYRMTSFQPYELYIQLVDVNNEINFARYGEFQIGNEKEKFLLKKLNKFTGNVRNRFVDHVGHKFTTFDNDNDNSTKLNYAVKYHGGWWYFDGVSYGCNLNGKHFTQKTKDETRTHWGWRTYKGVKMLIRPCR